MTCFIWQPKRQAVTEEALLGAIEEMTYLGKAPVAPELVAMLGDISHAILNHPQARGVPQYVALGYWLRPAALKRMINEWHTGLPPEEAAVMLPRGVALHLPPTNVDTIFAYSWALSVLSGNCNIVRLAESLSTATSWLVDLIVKHVEQHGESHRQIFMSYPYGGALEQKISRLCDLRLIWGGDQKALTVSKTPIRPDGLSIAFPDRKSLAVIKSDSYLNATAATRDKLAEQFYNDIFWFDQMGCSSPRVLVWIGQKQELANDLFVRLANVIKSKNLLQETGVAISKLVHANDLLAEDIGKNLLIKSNELTVVEGDNLSALLERSHGGGFLNQIEVEDFSVVASALNRKIQTVTHFGFNSEDLVSIARQMIGKGGYRLVPIGQALQFERKWDGIDLLSHFTRQLTISQCS